MADPRIVREWLSKADDDFNFAKTNLEEDHKFYSQICFHFQQAAEKYLKKYLANRIKANPAHYIYKSVSTFHSSLNG